MANVKIISLDRGEEGNLAGGKNLFIGATFSYDGDLIPLKVSKADRPEVFAKVDKLLDDIKNNKVNLDDAVVDLFNLMSPEARVKQHINSSYYLSKNLSIQNGHIFFGDNRLEETLANHMMSLLDEENVPKDEKMWRSYVKFLDNLYQNADEDIRQQLFRWMEYENKAGNGFAITDDGCIVGYKGCEGSVLEPVSVFSGNAIVDGVEVNGKIPNKVGSVIEMPRSAVQKDPAVGCSVGLHVGTRDYATQWAPILLLVKVNPRDVVSVPYECESQKMRVCRYEVLKVIDASEEHRMYHETNSTEDDSDNFPTSEAYNLLGKEIYVEYDSDSVAEGVLVDVYEDGVTNIIIETEDGDHVDIELSRVDYYEVLDDDSEDEDFKLTLEDAYNLKDSGEEILVIYDGKSHQGVVVDVYEARFKDPGIIVKSDDGEYKHIKLYRIEHWEYVEGETEEGSDEGETEENPEDQLNNSIEQIYGLLSEQSCSCQGECKVYEYIYTTPVGTDVTVVYDDRGPELKEFSGEVVAVNKCDMEITLRNDSGEQVKVRFTDIISFDRS